jgi:AcrR family transcriptional regulator
MITRARHIRALVEHLPGARQPPTPAQQDRQTYILQAGRLAISQFGFESITLSQFSLGLRLTPSQIRWHYPDLENLLGAIFRDHLKTIGNAIDDSVHDPNDPDLHQAARAAYFAATRDANGSFTEAHRLFLRDRHHLPEDEAKSVDLYAGMLARALGGDTCGMAAMDLLNTETHTLADIEDAMAGLISAEPAAGPAPTIINPLQARPAEPPYAPPQLPRHIRRKIEALRRQRQGKK